MPENQYYQRNMQYAKPSRIGYITQLSEKETIPFLKWTRDNKVPYDRSQQADYDMPGFWRALTSGNQLAKTAVDPNDNRIHYPDYWKTPYHQTFSNESQWATPGAPSWNEHDQLVLPNGRVIFDDKAQPPK